MSFWDSLWNILVVFFWAFVFISALFAMIAVVTDLIRDKKLNGWWKALWLIFLVFVPLLTSLIYLIARGGGMADRSVREAEAAQRSTDDYIRSVASVSTADEIAKAKALLDAGTIDQAEFARLKERILG
ncbi:MAG: SHOCT domain-containing protein [Actinobacteria bacterium]|nr:SHOCT domain-containing protein [Actinomycetota bacterium]